VEATTVCGAYYDLPVVVAGLEISPQSLVIFMPYKPLSFPERREIHSNIRVNPEIHV